MHDFVGFNAWNSANRNFLAQPWRGHFTRQCSKRASLTSVHANWKAPVCVPERQTRGVPAGKHDFPPALRLPQPWALLLPHASRGGALAPPGLVRDVPCMTSWGTMHGSPPIAACKVGNTESGGKG